MEVALGLQSYSLRKMSYEEAVETAARLGFKTIEAFPGHLPPDRANVARAKTISERNRVRLVAHGVNALQADAAKLTGIFEFAEAVGIEVITADPDPASIALLDRLVGDYGIAVAIHNHGPGHRYATVEEILEAVRGHHELIGMCLDTGHLARAGEDITEAVDKLGDRLHGLHLKDVDDNNDNVVIGAGRLDLKMMFERLSKSGILGRVPAIIEIEMNPDDPIQNIGDSLKNVQGMLRHVQ